MRKVLDYGPDLGVGVRSGRLLHTCSPERRPDTQADAHVQSAECDLMAAAGIVVHRLRYIHYIGLLVGWPSYLCHTIVVTVFVPPGSGSNGELPG